MVDTIHEGINHPDKSIRGDTTPDAEHRDLVPVISMNMVRRVWSLGLCLKIKSLTKTLSYEY